MPRLALGDLTLSHFRSHQRTEMRLDGRPVALFGPNGSGKTNVLEAISLLSPGRGIRRAAAEALTRKPEALGWKLSATLASLHQIHEIETFAEAGGARQVRVGGKSSTQVALGRVARVLWLVPAMDRLWIEGADGRRRFLDRMTLSLEPSHAETVLSYEKAMRERNRLLKDMVRDTHWYSALEQQMAVAGAQIAQNRAMALQRLSEAQAGAKSAFPKVELAIAGPDGTEIIAEEDALLEALSQGRPQDIRAGRTLVGPHRADLIGHFAEKGIAAAQCSTGEQKALLLSLILANARAVADDFGAAPLLLLDEVAAHLDAERRAALYDEICGLGAQAWMTGTGAELFDTLRDRAQFFEVTDADGVSAVTEVPAP